MQLIAFELIFLEVWGATWRKTCVDSRREEKWQELSEEEENIWIEVNGRKTQWRKKGGACLRKVDEQVRKAFSIDALSEY